jgi:hypothetical protein
MGEETIMENINTTDIEPKHEDDKKCSPTHTFDNGSCIKLVALIELAKAYNTDHKDKPIKLYPNFEMLNPKKYKKYLISEFNKKMKGVCTTQECWTKQDFVKHLNAKIKEELEKYTFRPKGPEGKWEWLNTLNINDVMNQYEKKYPEFDYLGTVPIDFDDLPKLGIKNLDFNQLVNKGKTKIGIVFNLDKHNESGSHWVALFADLKKCQIYFFDSYGTEPEPEIRKLVRRIANFCKEKYNIPESKIITDYNKKRHQFGDSECGVYSMNFILRMLETGDFEKSILSERITDNAVNQCRGVYFRGVPIKGGDKEQCYA